MKLARFLISSIMAIFLFSAVCDAASWILFFKNAAQMDFYYEKDSITYTSDKTILVWQKIVPQENAKSKPWIEATELREVDCDRKRYKILQGRRTYENKPIENKTESSWIYLEPDDLDTAFNKAICEENKKK